MARKRKMTRHDIRHHAMGEAGVCQGCGRDWPWPEMERCGVRGRTAREFFRDQRDALGTLPPTLDEWVQEVIRRGP